MNLQLKKFDMSSMKDDKVVVFIGKRETGKSFLVRDLLYYQQDIPIGTVISATESANCYYGKMIPNLFIHDEYTPSTISNVIKRQKLVIKKMQEDFKKKNRSNIDPRAFLILDDCMYDSTWTKDKNIRSLFMNGRHYKILFLITMQYSMGIPPNLRTNVDYVFILRENIISNRKRLYEQYAGMFKTFEIFCQVMDQCTENFECVVINNNAKTSKLDEQVFWYKADPHPDFRMGAEKFWEYHTTNYNGQNYGEKQYDPSSTTKRGQVINVKKNVC